MQVNPMRRLIIMIKNFDRAVARRAMLPSVIRKSVVGFNCDILVKMKEGFVHLLSVCSVLVFFVTARFPVG